MKYVFLWLLFTSIGNSQIKSGIIDYKVKLDTIEGLKNSKYFKNNLNRAIVGAEHLDFTLTFDNQNSFFEMKEIMDTENREIYMAKIFSNYRGKTFQNKEFSFAKIDNEFGKYNVKKEVSKNWIITSDVKYIDKYKCYKATTEYIVVNPKGTFKFPVIAWFCPEIPVPFGPNGYGNLPGLILELQERNVVFGVKKIALNSEVNLNYKPSKDDVFLTELEFNTIIEKLSKNVLDGK